MIKIEFDGENYYYDRGKFYDGTFCEMPQKESRAVAEYYFSQIDVSAMSFNDFIAYLNDLDNGGFYGECMQAIERGFEIFKNEREYATVTLPKLLKMYRLQNRAADGALLWQNVWQKKLYEVESAPLYTVLGAIYADLENWEQAERYANKAYNMLGGKKNEHLSSLYMRINKRSNI